MNVSDIKKLSSLRGMPLLDFAAELTHKPKPSVIADPLLSPEPILLDRAINDWGYAASGMSSQIEDFRQTVTLVLNAWDAPDGFLTYTSSVTDAMLAQQKAMNDIKAALDACKKRLEDDKRACERKKADVVIAVVGVAFSALIGFAAALLTGPAAGGIMPAAVTALIASIGGMIMGFIAWAVAASRAAEDAGADWEEKMKVLKEIAERDGLSKIQSPRVPDLSNVKSFRPILD